MTVMFEKVQKYAGEKALIPRYFRLVELAQAS